MFLVLIFITFVVVAPGYDMAMSVKSSKNYKEYLKNQQGKIKINGNGDNRYER